MDNQTSTPSLPQENKKPKISFILGLIGLVAWLLPILGLPIQIIALIFGIQGLSSPTKKNFAIAAIVLAILGLMLSIVNAAFWAYFNVMNQIK